MDSRPRRTANLALSLLLARIGTVTRKPCKKNRQTNLMNSLFYINWKDVFVPNLSIAEIVLRGTLVYLGLFALLRLVLNRQAGTLSTTDLLVVVLIADAAQNGMANEYKSITAGLILVALKKLAGC